MTFFPKSFLSFEGYPEINWNLLSKSQQFYSNKGYQYCEVPYLIPEEYGKITKPHEDRSFVLSNHLFQEQNQELLGSAEQGFIYLIYQNLLPNKKLYSITPCFRTEKYDNQFHLPWFMKCELFHLSNNIDDCIIMLKDAFEFYTQIIDKNDSLDIVKTSETTWDINLNNIEIGSYGFRDIPNHIFIYGTGLALPRFSVAGKYGK